MSLKIKDLTKRFGEKQIFSGFSYEFPDAGVFAVVGESGIGKTTLLRMIAGLDTKFDGDIAGGGFKNISFAFQEYRLFPTLSALDNVIFAVSDKKDAKTEEAAKNMLKRLGFTDRDVNLFPSELSGGMKQRVSLARAFLKNAPILLLDEPTKELDAEHASEVVKVISELSVNTLIIMVTHREQDVKSLSPTTITL